MTQPRPTIIYFCFDEGEENHRRKLDGIFRFARPNGWRVVAFPPSESSPEGIMKALARYRPMGCIVECSGLEAPVPASVFRGCQVVRLDPPALPRSRGEAAVLCDNSAVARAAFRELSAGLPVCCAAVPSVSLLPWNTERIAVFQALCSDSGLQCLVFPGRRGEAHGERVDRMAGWIRKLPNRCAVFASSDNAARDVALAARMAFRTIPRELSLLGVDGRDEETGDDALPRASSVQLDFELAGYLAAKALGIAGSDERVASFGPLCVLRRRSTQGRGRREPRVLKAVEIIRREACGGLTAADLAARFPGSRGHFERRFREAMGHSVLDEILHVRLENAKVLLSRPDIAIGAIYHLCGFGSASDLRTHFRKAAEMSLRQWRRDHLRRR